MAARYREATPHGVHRSGWGGDEAEELDVFGAERYFNGDDPDPLWCARSSSSFSSAFRTGTHDRDPTVAATVTAATSSSEASWNSRSAPLPDARALAVPSGGVVVDEEPRGTGVERPRGKPPPPPAHLRRWQWLLGVAGCACVGGDGEGSESADDEVEDENFVGDGGEKIANEARELFPSTESKEEAVADVEAAFMRVRPGRDRSLDDSDAFLVGKEAFSPVQVEPAGDGHRRAANSGEFSRPILDATTTSVLSHEQRRRSSEMLRPPGLIGRSALASAKEQDSAFTIVAGNRWRVGGDGLRAAGGGGGGSPTAPRSPCDTREDDDAAPPSELGCAYPPSEASVVWSVVTAEGAASCNFSSAASVCYYHFNGGEDGAVRHAAGRSSSRRRRGRSGVTNGGGGGLLTCMGEKAVNAVGPARWPAAEPACVGWPGAPRDGRNSRVRSTTML